MSSPLTAVLMGAGQRGAESYAPYALTHPEALRFVAVAEPDPQRRQFFCEQHDIPPAQAFESWEDLLAQPKLADTALVCTQDELHTPPAVAAMRAGYHVLLEKPMANRADECRLLLAVSQETKRQLFICHVLRYTKHFAKMREIIESGVLGEIVQVAQRENVAFWHATHSYVRGNWRNEAQSSPMILAKCCHDLDILPWMLQQQCVQLTSMGGLNHFRPENAPAGAPKRCLDGCPVAESCPYYAPHIYLEMAPFWNGYADTAQGFPRWAARTYTRNPALIKALSVAVPMLKKIPNYSGMPRSVLDRNPTQENLLHALQVGPYGRCVYHCDNDVVDHQVVMMRMSGGPLVTLTMHSHSHHEHRSTRIEGSHGRLMAEFGMGGAHITVDEHRTDWHETFDTSGPLGEGHGGGDFVLVENFINSVRRDDFDQAYAATQQALQSHLMAFAAEESRHAAKVLTQEAWEV